MCLKETKTEEETERMCLREILREHVQCLRASVGHPHDQVYVLLHAKAPPFTAKV